MGNLNLLEWLVLCRSARLFPSVLLLAIGCAKPDASNSPSTEPTEVLADSAELAKGEIVTDVLHYKVELEMLNTAGLMRGTAQLDVRPTLAVDLELETLKILSIARADGGALIRNRNRLEVPAGEAPMRQLRIVYEAKTDRGVRREQDTIYTSFNTADWMPVNFSPSDRASITLTVTVPPGFKVAAPGKQNSIVEREDATVVTFQLDRPNPSYIFGFAVGAFEEFVDMRDGVRHRVLYRGLEQNEVEKLVDKAQSAIAFFAEKADQPYPGETFTQVWVPGRIAQELVDMATMSASQAQTMLTTPTEDWLLVHEISHQWWGNTVTCRSWSEFWLNEGFATFMVAAYKEHAWGREAYARELTLARERLVRIRTEGIDRALVLPQGTVPDDAGGPVPYQKGFLFLDELRTKLGEETFWAAIQAYTKLGWERGVTTKDLRRTMEQASQRELQAIFSKWGALADESSTLGNTNTSLKSDESPGRGATPP